MKKTLLQFSVLVLVFFSSWFLLGRVPFVKALKLHEVGQSTEEKVGDLIYQSIAETETEEDDSTTIAQLNKIKTALCKKNDIDADKIKLHLIKKSDVNAFALPNNHLVVYTGLITFCDDPEELAGVLGHEIAHIEHHHVMKKLTKEIGFSVLFAMAGGKGGGEVAKQAAKMLSSSAYDRKWETDADKTSIDYMVKADIDPEPFANLMFKFSTELDGKIPKELYWIADHPQSEERAKALETYIKTKKVTKRPLMEKSEWDDLKERVEKM